MDLTNALYKVVEDKTITWFKNSNEYLVLEHTTAAILKRLSKGVSVKEIAVALSKKIDVPLEKSEDFILHLKEEVYDPNTKAQEKIINDHRDIITPKTYEFVKFYKVNEIVFKTCYLSETELYYIHPKFAHLTIDATDDYQNEFEVFVKNKFIFLYVNKECIGSWSHKDVHFFQGKFSMEFIQKIHQKPEEYWMGVFHASAISNGKKSMLFLGDSGNGKSTSLALLQANGFTCLADDFVPMDMEKKEVYSFPASISIKKNSLATLLPLYPELETSAEFHFKRLNKIVRYLKPNNTDYLQHLPCNDLIFIKYEKDSGLSCKKISKIDAFQQLIPDSWLSPITKNAQVFLDWFDSLNCYQLTYSENEKMIATVSKIFDDQF
ncbi:hypothetical protein [Polaribacter sp. R77954]|uniref:hypothetical protein n=1 Tax=Polaribacter sp. R77954 TaxID=3093870 RepID=UPI0037C51AB0